MAGRSVFKIFAARLAAEIEKTSRPIQWTILLDKNEDGFGVMPASESCKKSLSDRDTNIADVSEAFLGEFRRLCLFLKKTRVVVLSKDTFKLPWEPLSTFRQNTDMGHWYASKPDKSERLAWRSTLTDHMLRAMPQGSTALECLQIVNIHSLTAIILHDVGRLLQNLPSLHLVTVDSGVCPRNETNSTNNNNRILAMETTEARPITESLPELTRWANRHERRFATVWKPLEEKGVRLCLRDAETKAIVLEILLEGHRLVTRGVPSETGFRNDLTASREHSRDKDAHQSSRYTVAGTEKI